MRIHISFRVILGIVLCLTLFGIAAFTAFRVNAQNQSTNDIEARLKQKGVSVRSVKTKSRIPYEVEISLNSQSKDKHLSLDDNWSMILVNREATMAYRFGARIDRYRINIFNANGQLISSTDTFVYPEDSAQKITTNNSAASNQKVKSYALSRLNLNGFKQDLVDVIPEDNLGSPGQTLMIQLSAKDVETANQAMPALLASLFKLLDTVNSNLGSKVVLCHLRIVDNQGNILFDLVKDLETHETQWSGSPDITYTDWFSKPYEAPLTPDQSIPSQPLGVPTVSSLAGYPPPGTTQTPAYP